VFAIIWMLLGNCWWSFKNWISFPWKVRLRKLPFYLSPYAGLICMNNKSSHFVQRDGCSVFGLYWPCCKISFVLPGAIWLFLTALKIHGFHHDKVSRCFGLVHNQSHPPDNLQKLRFLTLKVLLVISTVSKKVIFMVKDKLLLIQQHSKR
jgi:hypothetical protein